MQPHYAQMTFTSDNVSNIMYLTKHKAVRAKFALQRHAIKTRSEVN